MTFQMPINALLLSLQIFSKTGHDDDVINPIIFGTFFFFVSGSNWCLLWFQTVPRTSYQAWHLSEMWQLEKESRFHPTQLLWKPGESRIMVGAHFVSSIIYVFHQKHGIFNFKFLLEKGLESAFQIMFRVTDDFQGVSRDVGLPRFSCSSTQYVRSGNQLSRVLDLRSCSYLEHCEWYEINMIFIKQKILKN